MGQTNLSWQFDGPDPEEFRVYRADAPMDPGALPTPLATAISGTLRSYTDTTVVRGNTYYYRVSALKGTVEKVSDEITHVAEVGDPYWANVVSLLHFDGADGSTTFTDEKGAVWTPYGDAKIVTAQSMFGGASAFFDGSGDALQTPHTSSLDLDSTEWTIEAYLRRDGTGGPKAVLSKRVTSGTSNAGWTAFTNGGSVRMWNGSSEVGTPSVLSANVWTHVVWQRRAGNLEIYVGGTLQYSGTYAITANSYPVTIGCAYFNGGRVDFFGGHIDELRITKGVARYTADFTPPTEPFPNFGS